MSYLERWWRDAPKKKQEDLAKLVRNGQLEIVSGGWVMNDEVREAQFCGLDRVLPNWLTVNAYWLFWVYYFYDYPLSCICECVDIIMALKLANSMSMFFFYKKEIH
jgi:alpha-mannosidase II